MNKRWSVLALAFFITASVSAQTLFTYGKYSATSKEFLRAFNKNNTATGANKSKAMRDYLNLYINSRLKIREAYNRQYDTLPNIKNDIENLRSQVIENYLNDQETADKLLKEAFARSQKDIHVGHIYISFRNKNGIDTAQAELLANQVYERLKKGEDFGRVAQELSSDPQAIANKGDIGWVTVFSLPYEFENIIYNTAPGKFSEPYKSKIGFHIFKNIEERKAVGHIRAAQILLAFPPGADDEAKKKISLLADSLYQRLVKGADMIELAAKYSNDYISAASGGVMPEFTVGEFDPVFENAILGIKKDSAFAKPFMTSHGYHIVQRLQIIPPVTDPKDKENMDKLKAKVNLSDRMQYAKRLLMAKVLKQVPIKYKPYSLKDLSILSDSLLDGKRLALPVTITRETPLFSISNQIFTVNNFITYAQAWRYKSDGTGVKPYPQIMDEYTNREIEDYYRKHLEDFNEDFRNQMNEFKDGNLFFEIMQREVWNKAQTDTVALRAFYDKNKAKYNWKESADAVIFFCTDEKTSKDLYNTVKANPTAWKTAADAQVEKAVADSARYEFSQIPNADKSPIKVGMVTSPVVNKTDGTVSFAYVMKTYPAGLPRNFAEAKGIVTSDFQNSLEKQWVANLKKKYPVKINEVEFQKISK